MQRASDVAKATAAYPAVLATFEDELQELRPREPPPRRACGRCSRR
jgi:hypothetical protein